jgi:hypothetical protein
MPLQQVIIQISLSTRAGMKAEQLLVDILFIVRWCHSVAVGRCKAVLGGGNVGVSATGAERNGKRTRTA